MNLFDNFLLKIELIEHRKRTKVVIQWIMDRYPLLEPRIAWNQQMFTDHGTFIISINVSMKHLSVSPEI